NLRPVARRREGLLPMSVEIEVVDDPARACAAMMVGAAADGGQVVLAGGSTPRAANEEFVAAVNAVGLDLSATTIWFGDERALPPGGGGAGSWARTVRATGVDDLSRGRPRPPRRGACLGRVQGGSDCRGIRIKRRPGSTSPVVDARFVRAAADRPSRSRRC